VVFLKEAKGREEASIDAVVGPINRFEGYTRHRDFKAFHFEQARGFKAHFMAAKTAKTGQPLSASTVHSSLAALKAFFIWLADQLGYTSR
jgi:integrase/recombinase XerD